SFSCGEQACRIVAPPALGCEAAPNPVAEFFQEHCSAFIGAASHPSASKLARHNSPLILEVVS
ncbi:hypothetical protein FEM54_33465, partial [Pseudomonas edaphica]